MLNQEGSHVDDETVLRFQQLGFGEEEIRTALLCFEGDVERAGSWLLEQPREPTRERLAPQPLVPLAEGGPVAVPREPLAASGDVGRRRLLAARALQREAKAKRERREKEEARLRDLKAQEQAEIDRKRARARLAAERNQAAAGKAEEHARAGRPTHADAAESRAGRAGRPFPQAGPPTAAVPVVPEPQPPAPVPRPAPATPPHPAPAAHPSDAPAMPERKLRMLLQQEAGLAAGEAAQVAKLCAARGVLASEPLVLDVSPAGIEMRALMLESALATLKGRAGAGSSAMAEATTLPSVPPTSPPPPPLQAGLQQESTEHPAPPPPPIGAIAAKPEPAARDLIASQDEEFAAALASDQRADAIAAARTAPMTAPEMAEQTESAATTAVASDVAEDEPVVVLSAQEMRERRIAALERRAAADDDPSGMPSPAS